ncbi:polyprenyl synthetase family protein [soil metagenome]
MTGSTTPATDTSLADATSSFDAILESAMKAALSALDGPAPILPGMANYHLGFADAEFNPATLTAAQRGKRLRPGIAMLACGAAGGDPKSAAPLAAAIELLHNFTLVHDDIQDQSPSRRHRPTVWTLWGVGQAINAGDAIFAAAHRALYRLRDEGVDADLVINLAENFDTMTIQIVQGQSLDLGFEGRSDITPDDYLKMIELKTAVIVRFAAWAGAMLAGAGDERAELFGAFGLALGVGFQVRDDLLGIWGTSDVTGKAAADDIRRRKQSLPILILRNRASTDDLTWLDERYAATEIDEDGVRGVLALLEKYEVREEIEAQIVGLHDGARIALGEALSAMNRSGSELATLVDMLAVREH